MKTSALWVAVYVVGAMLISAMLAAYNYGHGLRVGACTEMCRPLKFDSDQTVNGGCLCIGSDKVLRFKKDP
jgi:hypothetical protein